jgi:phosphoglycolate phosphatase-like HAD superfamily hydrolase
MTSLTNDDGYPRKPDPAAFEAALREYGLERAETIAIGDRDIDVLAGQAAGLFTCLFGAEADGCTPELTVSNYDQLYRYIQSANSAR